MKLDKNSGNKINYFLRFLIRVKLWRIFNFANWIGIVFLTISTIWLAWISLEHLIFHHSMHWLNQKYDLHLYIKSIGICSITSGVIAVLPILFITLLSARISNSPKLKFYSQLISDYQSKRIAIDRKKYSKIWAPIMGTLNVLSYTVGYIALGMGQYSPICTSVFILNIISIFSAIIFGILSLIILIKARLNLKNDYYNWYKLVDNKLSIYSTFEYLTEYSPQYRSDMCLWMWQDMRYSHFKFRRFNASSFRRVVSNYLFYSQEGFRFKPKNIIAPYEIWNTQVGVDCDKSGIIQQENFFIKRVDFENFKEKVKNNQFQFKLFDSNRKEEILKAVDYFLHIIEELGTNLNLESFDSDFILKEVFYWDDLKMGSLLEKEWPEYKINKRTGMVTKCISSGGEEEKCFLKYNQFDLWLIIQLKKYQKFALDFFLFMRFLKKKPLKIKLIYSNFINDFFGVNIDHPNSLINLWYEKFDKIVNSKISVDLENFKNEK